MADVSGTKSNMDYFDENLLFSEFDAVGKEVSAKNSTKNCYMEQDPQNKALKDLEAENSRLKAALKKLTFPRKNGSESPPFVQAVFFDNERSKLNRNRIESFFASLIITNGGKEVSWISDADCSSLCPQLPSLSSLNEVITECRDCSRDDDTDVSKFSVINCVYYFEFYCIDYCGLSLVDYNPSDSDGWEIPSYDQVFFTVLPCLVEDAKIRIRHKKTCFNCGGVGHNVADCPEPQNSTLIEARRREFLNKFSSPIGKGSRYHANERRFGEFKPGIISDKLREAIGIGQDEVPPYVYKMRILGYPPGYLPSGKKPSLLLYDGCGNVDDYIMDDFDEDEENSDEDAGDKKSKNMFIEYPGFNCPLPDGVRDNSAQIGFPPMNPGHEIAQMEWWYKQHPERRLHLTGEAQRHNRKRKRETQTGASDMELDDEDGQITPFDLGTPTDSPQQVNMKRGRYDDQELDDGEGGYSPCHPGVQIGEEEKKLLQHYHHSSSDTKEQPPLPSEPFPTTNPPPLPTLNSSTEASTTSDLSKKKVKLQRKLSSGSKEEGEIISDEESENEECEEGEEEVKSSQGWWLEEPLSLSSRTPKKVLPPPIPAIKLPMDLLTRFYTSSTVLQRVSFEDRVMWLDPIYGNIQVSSGRYDRLKEILQKVKKRK